MTPVLDRNGNPATFGYDSWRSVSNWSVDYAWWHKDPRETILSDRLQKFLESQGIDKFVDRYTLDGKPLSDRCHSVGMLADRYCRQPRQLPPVQPQKPSSKPLERPLSRTENNAITTECSIE